MFVKNVGAQITPIPETNGLKLILNGSEKTKKPIKSVKKPITTLYKLNLVETHFFIILEKIRKCQKHKSQKHVY